jgi:hypothetical protein
VIDSIADKGIFHKNKAARHKSRLAAKVKALAASGRLKAASGTRCKRARASGPFFHALGRRRVNPAGASGIRQASATCSSLSRAKFMTKSQAIGSRSRSASLTITHLTPSITRGTQYGE